MRILLIEDDLETSRFVTKGLSSLSHQIACSFDGRDGLFEAMDNTYDALIIDRMLPSLDGLELVRALRASGRTVPIIMLTAIAGLADRVEGLDVGADDYLAKPFALSELAARIHALGRRPTSHAEPTKIAVAGIVIDLVRRTVERAGKRIILKPREFELLAELVRNQGQIMTKNMLLERVWDIDFDPRTNIVETHLSRIRTKLNADFETDAIETVRGIGYVIRNS